MTIDEVVDEVAEGHPRHKIEHTGAECNDRCFGEGEILKTIVRKINESDARHHSGHHARHYGDGAIVNLPRLQTLFDEKSAESGHKHNADGRPVALKQTTEGGIGGSSQEEHNPIAQTRYFFNLLQLSIGLIERHIFGENLVGKSAQACDGVEVDARVRQRRDTSVGMFTIFVPQCEQHIGRHNGENHFNVPGFSHLFDFSLDAHSGGSARKQGASVVAKEFSDVFELIVDFMR